MSRPLSMVYSDEFSWPMAKACDAVFMQRPSSDKHVKDCIDTKRLGLPLWVDYDDDLLSVPTDNPTYAIYGQEKIQKNVIQMLQMADVVTVSTKALAETMMERGIKQRFVVIENGADLDEQEFPAMHKKSDVVLWRGSQSHVRDVLSVAEELEKIINADQDHEWDFMGDRLWFLTDNILHPKIRIVPPLKLLDYFDYLRSRSPGIVMAPLVDNRFNRAKSNIAWIEATMVGAICICSDLPEWQREGAINYKNPQDFVVAFKAAFDASAERLESMWQKSVAEVKNTYCLEVQNKKREEILLTLCS